jgi:hypothetical protein
MGKLEGRASMSVIFDLACEPGVPRLEVIFEEIMQLAAGIEHVNSCSKYDIYMMVLTSIQHL